jgi:bifunctional non-homologous end joining protein LigD
MVWLANLAALELHVPQWTVGPRGARRNPDLLVFDLDPGPQTSIVECCRVGVRIRERLAEDGLTVHGKTSGSKGLQLYAPVKVSGPEQTSDYARKIAGELAKERPRQVTATMARSARPGKVFVDWSQNNPAKTTVAAYSLRARPRPTVSTPVSWAEIENCEHVSELTFTADDVRARVEAHGDLFADLHTGHARLPSR